MDANAYLAIVKLMVRRIISFTVLLTGMWACACAQSSVPVVAAPNFPGVILRWSGGYAWQPGKSSYLPAPVINTLTPDVDAFGNLSNISTPGGAAQTLHGSYGQGFNVGMQLGYMFNPYIGVVLGVAYAQSATYQAYQQTVFYQADTAGNPAATGGYLDNNISTKSQSLVLSPCIMAAYSKPKFKFYPYLRAGVVLPVFTRITHSLTMNLEGADATNASYNAPYFLGDINTVTMQTNAAFTVGFTGAVGVVWRPVSFINFFAEISGQYLSMKAKSTTITEWTADGVDLIPYRGPYRTQFDYVKSLNGNSNNAQYNANYNPNLPKQDKSPAFPFNNLGFNVGVQLVLSKKVFKDEDGFDQYRGKKEKKPLLKKKKKKEEPKTDSGG